MARSLKVSVRHRIPEINRAIILAIDRELTAAALATQAHVVRSLNTGQRSGRLYPRGTKVHQASAPGEPPKSDTGRLANGILVSLETPLSKSCYTNVEYAPGLEIGTKAIAARPFMRPAFDVVAKVALGRLRFITASAGGSEGP